MKNVNQCLYVLTFTLMLISCGTKPKNPSNPEIRSDSGGTTMNNETNRKDGSNPDESFVMEAAEGGLFEVMLGELAVKKGSAKVKKLGKMMVEDHTKVNTELKKMASEKHISIPGSLGNDLQKKYDELKKKSGKDFDKAYANMMVNDHKEDIKKFRKEAEDGKDPDVKKFASEKLPTLEHHLQMSEETQKHCNSR